MSKYILKNSKIHGRGVFSTDRILTQELIASETIIYTRVGKKLTTEQELYGFFIDDYVYVPKGIIKYVNHSDEPNAKVVIEDGKIYLLSIEEIPKNTEITIKYPNWII